MAIISTTKKPKTHRIISTFALAKSSLAANRSVFTSSWSFTSPLDKLNQLLRFCFTRFLFQCRV